MSFSTHPLPAKSRGGFALISVLALVSLAALTATAFLASARLERQATLPLGNTLRLEWALTSGEKAAQQTLNDTIQPAEGTAKNFVTTIWRGTDPNDWTKETGYLLIGEPNSTNNVRWTYYAGFSPAGLTSLTTNVIGTNMSFTNSNQGTYFSESTAFFNRATNGFTNNPAPTNPICTTIPLLGGQTSPPVGWVYLTQRMRQKNSTNTVDVTSPVARVAWFLEDLSGKIDAEQMGGLSSSRLTGTNPEEICLTSMTGTNGSQILPSLTTFTNATNRKMFFTPGLLAKSSISGLTNSDDLRYFATGLREFRPINRSNNNGMLDWIPCGIPVAIVGTSSPSTNSYANGGYSKLSLNQLIALSAPNNVTSIAAVISNNLPNFASIRAGGFTNTNGGGATNTNAYTRSAYYLTLAANIVDYADTDSTPTTDGTALSTNRNRPVYRGADNCPYVNEINKRYLLTSTSPMTIGGVNGLAYRVETTDYLELWNPSSQSTQAGTLTFLAVHGQPATLGFSSISFTNPLWASNSSGSVLNGVTSNNLAVPVIPPNGFVTLACATTTNLFFYPSTTNPPVFTLTQEFTNSRYFVAWNGVYYDAAMGGIRRNSGNLALNSPANRANLPSFIYATSGGNFTNPAVGDPRATIYLSQVQDFNAYVGNATFGGRNIRAGSVPPTREYYEVTPKGWPDGGHSSPNGSSPTSDNQIPTSFAPINTNLPPGRISNTGSLSNICELGGVFDPIQWADPSLGVWQGKWTNLSISASNNNTFGGGTSLRIGRAEHGKFAFTNFAGNSSPWIPNMGGSSAALLDLFCVSNGNTGGGPFRTGGKINLNTAPAPVLRALAGGILLTNDQAQQPRNAAIPPAMAEAFAQGVMRFRSQYPFLTPSHLCFIGTDPGWPNTTNWPSNAVFGNTNSIFLQTNAPGNTYGASARINVTAWNDQAAEEWFTKIYNLSTVQSDNYRAYIVAQLVDSNRMPISPVMRKYVQFAGRPNNPNTSDITNNGVYGVPMYFWPFTKGLKKVYESPY